MTFNIGSMQAGNVNMVSGDQHISGGQYASVCAPPAIVASATTLRSQLPALIDRSDRLRAQQDLGDVEDGLATGRLTKQGVAERLSRVLAIVERAGRVIDSATHLGAALVAMAHWLGPLGAAVLRVIV